MIDYTGVRAITTTTTTTTFVQSPTSARASLATDSARSCEEREKGYYIDTFF